MSSVKYFNFPIQLLDGFMIDPEKVLNDISDYVIYKDSLRLQFGTKLEKMKESSDYYKMKLADNKKSLDNGELLYNSLPNNSPIVGLNLTIWWDFYKNHKTEFDKICLLGFLAIKSIIGTKVYHKITNHYWMARMDGKVNKVNDYLELSDEVRKYANEYQRTKIKNALRINWGLISYSRYCRGFYVSFKITLKQLMTEAEKRRISTKEKQYKEQQKQMLKEVLQELKATRLKGDL